MDKVIEIANRAVADYGFRQAVLYGADDIARRWELTVDERSVLEGPVLERLGALPIPVSTTEATAIASPWVSKSGLAMTSGADGRLAPGSKRSSSRPLPR